MKGCIVQRGPRTWRVFYDLGPDPETGQRRQATQTVHGAKRDAQRMLREMLHSLETGGYIKPTKLTVGEFLGQWLEGYASLHTRPSTPRTYQMIVRQHPIPAFGELPLTALRPPHLQGYYAKKLSQGRTDRAGGLAARTVHHHHRLLHTALEHP